VAQRYDLGSQVTSRAVQKLTVLNNRADVKQDDLLGPLFHLILGHHSRLDEKG
jgi:hypothetical protein